MDERLDQVFRVHYKRLVSMLCRRTGDPEVAQDLAQETLVRALRNLDRYDDERPMWPWLRAIALNLAASWASRRRVNASLEGVDRASESNDMLQVESRAALDSVMIGLTEPQRRALWLRYVEDQDSRGAAAALGLSVPAFKQLLHRARIRLRERLESLGEAALVPVLVPVRALQRLLGRGRGRSPGSFQRVLEAAASFGAAIVAIILVVGNPSVPSARADQRPGATAAQAAPILSSEGAPAAFPAPGAPDGAPAAETRTGQQPPGSTAHEDAPGGEPAAGQDVVAATATPGTVATAASPPDCDGEGGVTACTHQNLVPTGGNQPGGKPIVHDRPPGVIQMEAPYVEECLELECEPIDDLVPGNGLPPVVDRLVPRNPPGPLGSSGQDPLEHLG